MAPDTWVLYSSGFATDPDPLAVTFVVGTAIADDIIESLQTRFPELQHSRRSWGEYSTNQRSGHVQMVCDARRGALPEQQRAVVGAAHEIMLRCIERLERACHNGALTQRYDADEVMEMRRILDDASEDSAVSEHSTGYAYTKFAPWLNAVTKTLQQDPEIPELSHNKYYFLEALLLDNAVSADARLTTKELVKRALGTGVNPVTYKRDIAELRSEGFIFTKSGVGGGCWLTSTGLDLAKRIKK